MEIKNKIKRGGFSFIEVIISIFLVSVGIIAVLSLMASNLRETLDSQDQLIAAMLSQEGIELVRNVRDNNWVNDRDTFDTGASSGFPVNNSENCVIDSSVMTVITCFPGIFRLRFESSGSAGYNHGSITATNKATKFRRRIRFIKNISPDSFTVISSVTWNNTPPPGDPSNCKLSTKCVYTETTLTRWGEN